MKYKLKNYLHKAEVSIYWHKGNHELFLDQVNHCCEGLQKMAHFKMLKIMGNFSSDLTCTSTM